MTNWDSHLSLQSLDVALSDGAIVNRSLWVVWSILVINCIAMNNPIIGHCIYIQVHRLNEFQVGNIQPKSKGVCKITTTGLLDLGPQQDSRGQFIFTGILERVQRPGTATWET